MSSPSRQEGEFPIACPEARLGTEGADNLKASVLAAGNGSRNSGTYRPGMSVVAHTWQLQRIAEIDASREKAASPGSDQEPSSPMTPCTPRRESALWRRRRGTKGSLPTEIEHIVKPVAPWYLLEDRYKVKEKLGSGCACMVHRAVHLETSREVAIKTLRTVDSDLGNTVMREYDLLKQLSPHPYIIQAVDFHNLQGEAALVLEFFNGVTLQKVVEDSKRLPEATVHILCGALFKAVAHLHEHNVLHRDIKPQNVLISHCLQDLRLIDFNTAANLEGGEPLTPAGTPMYQAPEVVLGEPSCKYSDVWASGMCIFFALSGYLPQGRTFLDPSRKIQESVATQSASFDEVYWHHISADCKAMLQYCLSVERKGRPTMAKLLRDPWVLGATSAKSGISCLGRVATGVEAWLNPFTYDAIKKCIDAFCSLCRSVIGGSHLYWIDGKDCD